MAKYRSVDFSIQTAAEIMQKQFTDFTREDLYIGIPATVVGVKDYETQQVVDVKPVINDVYEDEELVQSVVLRSIFVKLQQGGGFSLKLPIAIGDLVTLHYCHRDISTFLDGKGEDQDANISLVADIRDCYVTHGFGTRQVNQKPSQTDFVIEGPKSTLTIDPLGNIKIETDGVFSVVSPAIVLG